MCRAREESVKALGCLLQRLQLTPSKKAPRRPRATRASDPVESRHRQQPAGDRSRGTGTGRDDDVMAADDVHLHHQRLPSAPVVARAPVGRRHVRRGVWPHVRSRDHEWAVT